VTQLPKELKVSITGIPMLMLTDVRASGQTHNSLIFDYKFHNKNKNCDILTNKTNSQNTVQYYTKYSFYRTTVEGTI
jgi:hypothetical protein